MKYFISILGFKSVFRVDFAQKNFVILHIVGLFDDIRSGATGVFRGGIGRFGRHGRDHGAQGGGTRVRGAGSSEDMRPMWPPQGLNLCGDPFGCE
ncbi:hypothetical protein [Celeribacter naphthalenivorans]|uniref:hypothetical protein n=1 Tax=Celeribacter naphthalenivorans TaxID=1614694 RepID=UPI001CFC3A6C|nr:hypothetical protein [Celeribacter naphthalenivorans]